MKKLKFSLDLDGKQIRNLDELGDNFNLTEILDLYKGKVLLRWLESRSMDTQADAIKKIPDKSSDETICESLCKIFVGSIERNEFDGVIHALKFKSEKEKYLDQIKAAGGLLNTTIADYHNKYNDLLKNIKENGYKRSYIREALQELSTSYYSLLEVDLERFLDDMIDSNSLIIMGMLANDKLKDLVLKYPYIVDKLMKQVSSKVSVHKIYAKTAEYLGIVFEKQSNQVNSKSDAPFFSTMGILNKYLSDKALVPTDVLNNIKSSPEKLTDESIAIISDICGLHLVTGHSDGCDKDIEKPDKECMVMYIDEGSYVHNYGVFKDDKKASDVNKLFPLLKGIQFKSSISNNKLVYLDK